MAYSIICAKCGDPIEGDDLEERVWGHEEGCPNRAEPGSVECDCDLEYHLRCACESTGHDHSQCYGFLWRCDHCGKMVCCADGTDDATGYSVLCDACWAEAATLCIFGGAGVVEACSSS